jgi:hypothetical protein
MGQTTVASATPVPSPAPVASPTAAIPPGPAAPTPQQDATQIVAQQLNFARQAYTDKRYDSAIAGAKSVLMIDPNNSEATDLLARATKAQARARQKAAPTPRDFGSGEQVATTPAVPQIPVNPSPSPTPQPAATTATLHIHAVSEFPGGGTLMVFMGDHQKARHEFPSWGGIFRRRPERAPEFNQNVEVPAGTVSLRVYVTPGGRSAQLKPLSGNFTGGSTRVLEVRLSADGQADASLR